MNENKNGPFLNTDRELWREQPGDYYANSIHVTERGGIGINVGGHVIVMPLRAWHEAAKEQLAAAEARGRAAALAGCVPVPREMYQRVLAALGKAASLTPIELTAKALATELRALPGSEGNEATA